MTISRNTSNRAQLKAAGISVCGPNRTNNQDAIYFDVGQIVPTLEEFGLFIVCDGLGGLQAGEIASKTAISVIVSALSAGMSQALMADGGLEPETIQRLLGQAIGEANTQLVQNAARLTESGGKTGTTATLALVWDGTAYVAHVGDSRLYVLRHDQMMQITHDHSLAGELARHGQIAPEEIVDHPRNNVLSRALGTRAEVQADLDQVKLNIGDRLLLCSDGLWKAFRDQGELNRLLIAQAEPELLVQQVVAEALKRDGSDNVSGVVVELTSRIVMKAENQPSGYAASTRQQRQQQKVNLSARQGVPA